MSSKEKHLAVIADEINKCRECFLCDSPGKHVPGEGNADANVVFVGEAAGATEAELGRPFVGRAGKLLDNMIASIGLSRNDVFISNICHCRPPNNRKPKPDEITACLPYLIRQLDIIKPKVIVALGSTALGGLTGQDGGVISRCGNLEEIDIYDRRIKLIPQFHPAGILRNPNWKKPAWYAMQKVAKELAI